ARLPRVRRIEIILCCVGPRGVPAGARAVRRFAGGAWELHPVFAVVTHGHGCELGEHAVRVAADVECILEHDEVGSGCVDDGVVFEAENDPAAVAQRDDAAASALARARPLGWPEPGPRNLVLPG